MAITPQQAQDALTTLAQFVAQALQPVQPPAPSEPVIKIVNWQDIATLDGAKDTWFKVNPGKVTSRITWKNISNCTFDGLNSLTFSTGKDLCFSLQGQLKNITLQNFTTDSCGNYQISVEGWKDIVYDLNDPTTFIDGLYVLNVTSNNAGDHAYLVNAPGTAKTGLIKNFQMSGCSYNNSPLGSTVCYLGNARGYYISGNKVNNVNTGNNNHNGLFWLCGNGQFIKNDMVNSQGCLGRFWPFAHLAGDAVQALLNTDTNGIKYSMFELQANSGVLGTSDFLPADATISQNTAVNLGTNKAVQVIDAQILDLYAFGGKLTYTNNKGTNLFTMNSKKSTDGINWETDKPSVNIIANSGNVIV